MPKKKRKVRRPSGSRASHRPAVRDAPGLVIGPARTYLQYVDSPDPDAPDICELMAEWPFRTTDAQGRGPENTLASTAAKSGETVRQAAESIVALEDAQLLLWQGTLDEYWMLVPKGQASEPVAGS